MSLALIDTGCANIASVRYALDRLGARYVLAETPDGASAADRLILPGVGAAGPAMARLRERGWADALQDDDRPLLGICLGMQLLFEFSEEGDADCLGLIPGAVRRLPRADGLVWPHMGWNALDALAEDEPLLAGIGPGERMYFVHGYYAPIGETCRARTQYGEAITAIARSGHVAGCQFHPERSGKPGARLLANFIGGRS